MYQNERQNSYIRITDYGPEPFAVNLNQAAMLNTNYRTALWTGEYLQMTLMQIEPGGDIGLEVHPDHDQFLMLISGNGVMMMGKTKEQLNYQKNVQNDYGIFVPAGTWHNLINSGNRPIKLFTVYGPPAHAHGTIHRTKEIAEQEESGYSR